MRGRDTVWPVMILVGTAALCVLGVRFVLMYGGTTSAQEQNRRLELRLRSFAPGASGRVIVLPNPNGGRVRLTALNLPKLQSVNPRARHYIVWAIAAGGRTLNLGRLVPDERGNGGLEFPSPTPLAPYSIIVTAEANERAANPLGAPVLSTRAGEIVALYDTAEPNRSLASVDAANAGTTGRNARRSSNNNSFYSEVDQALKAGESRTLTLIGSDIAPRAVGRARVAMQDGKAFVRARITKLPLPSAVGANVYVLWARALDGRIAYLGSLPANSNNTDIYVRAGLAFSQFDLFVTAETQRPTVYPQGRRALGTSAVRTRTRRRFWRRRRRPRTISS